jgi:hypothetical protein
MLKQYIMKKIFLLLLTTFTLSCCNKDDNTTTNPVDQLPPATQVGANTFGCFLDGKVFMPGTGQNTLDCVYQFIDGGYYFSLQANRRDENNIPVLIGCSTQKLQIFEGQTYQLREKIDTNAYGTFSYAANFTYTSQIQTGELKITKLTSNIVSGTFWFDIIDYQGNLHQIREGRFDVPYTN